MPTLQGSPNFTHLGPDDFPITLEAILTDYCGSGKPSFQWSSSNDNVTFSNPNARTTELNCDNLPTWGSLSLSVETEFDGYCLVSYLNPTYGTSNTPWCELTIHGPDTIVINEQGECAQGEDGIVPINVSVVSDVVTSGTIRVEIDGASLHGRLWTSRSREEIVNGSWSESFCDEREISHTFYFEAQSASDAYKQGRIAATWLPTGGGADSKALELTVVSVKCEPINNGQSPNGILCSSGVVSQGGRFDYRIQLAPSDYPSDKIRWSASNSKVQFVGGNMGNSITLQNVNNDVDGTLSSDIVIAEIGDQRVAGPAIPIKVCSKVTRIALHPYVVIDEVSADVEVEDYLSRLLPEVNKIFSQVGVVFYKASDVSKIVSNSYLDIDNNDNAHTELWRLAAGSQQGIPICLVRSIRDAYRTQRILGKYDGFGVLLCAGELTAQVLAHELGHAAGWSDIYSEDATGVLISEMPSKVRLPDDWSACGDIGYYGASTSQTVLIGRLLMCGTAGSGHVDIPCGSIYGCQHFLRYESISDAHPRLVSEEGLINVGWSGMNMAFTGEQNEEE